MQCSEGRKQPNGADSELAHLDLAVHSDGEVHAEEWVAKVGHGVDEARQRHGVAVHVQALEGEHDQVLAEAEVVSDAVGVEARAVDEVAGLERAVVRADDAAISHATLGPAADVASVMDEGNTGLLCVLGETASDLLRVRRRGGGRPQRDLVGADQRLRGARGWQGQWNAPGVAALWRVRSLKRDSWPPRESLTSSSSASAAVIFSKGTPLASPRLLSSSMPAACSCWEGREGVCRGDLRREAKELGKANSNCTWMSSRRPVGSSGRCTTASSPRGRPSPKAPFRH